jgi:hypothetical protein
MRWRCWAGAQFAGFIGLEIAGCAVRLSAVGGVSEQRGGGGFAGLSGSSNLSDEFQSALQEEGSDQDIQDQENRVDRERIGDQRVP